MNCLDRNALTEYLRGKLKPEELLAVSEHVSSCESCRRSLKELESYAPSAAYVRDAAFGVTECPEYEKLSAFVDGTLVGERLATVGSHVDQCDFCRSDVVTMRALRARAELAEQIEAKPVKFRRGFSWALFPAWQKAVAGTAVAAVVLGGLVIAVRPTHDMVAINPGADKPVIKTDREPSHKGGAVHGKSGPAIKIENPKPQPDKMASNSGETSVPTPPEVTSRPNDPGEIPGGSERPVNVKPAQTEERINLASLGVGGSLEARLEKALEQKLRNGTVNVDKPVMRAMLDTVRGSVEPSELAPKPIYPVKGVMKSSPRVLRWKSVDGAVSYRVTVQDESGRTIVRETVEGSEMTLPETLARGENYRWAVESNFGPGSGWNASKAVPFRVISAEESSAVERAEVRFRNHPEVLGTIYESLGLYDEAVRQFEKYSAANPSDLSSKMLSEARKKLASMK